MYTPNSQNHFPSVKQINQEKSSLFRVEVVDVSSLLAKW